MSREIRDVLQGKPPLLELSRLMWRIEHGRILSHDVRYLGKGLHEARLTYEGNEYRLYYSVSPKGEHVLLGLKFHKKGGQGAQDRSVEVARARLAEYKSRI
ncbi:hypothetical protein [Sphaerimonospora thailandensis]|uniref:hypothetical protein n=1 Tax=Sphaerimonospora thailandensis TaxID=795644 RepID=UPI001951260C|nr:hypothetical protein [Sphaerimonospora thailandensis]